MKIEYDIKRDLLYVYFATATKKVAKTITVMPGVHADFDRNGKIFGLEILEASGVIGKQIEFKLPEIKSYAKIL